MKWWKKLCSTVICLIIMLAFGDAHAVTVPILMYHNLTADPSAVNSMTVTDEQFRLDMEFLKEFNYTPLLPADLLKIQRGEMEIPSRPIMVTFDDGYRSNFDLGFPVLKQTGMKAAIAVIAKNIQPDSEKDNGKRSFMIWSELRQMHESGLVEIGSHSYNLHNPTSAGVWISGGANGVQRKSGESLSAYNARAGEDLQTSLRLIRENVGQDPVNYFVYPFGVYDSWMQQLLVENGVGVSALVKSGFANISGGLQNLYRLHVTTENPVSKLLQQSATATPSQTTVSVNGVRSTLPSYNIRGNNYVRVRDVALLLKDTGSAFDVQWNSERQRVELVAKTPYVPLGTELGPIGEESQSVKSNTLPVIINQIPVMAAAFMINDNNYYKLRTLGDQCGFSVAWNSGTQTVVVTA